MATSPQIQSHVWCVGLYTLLVQHVHDAFQVLPPAIHDTSIDEAAQLAAERGTLHARQTCLDCFEGGPSSEELVLAVDQGAIVNWEAYETLCHYIFYQQVRGSLHHALY